VLRRLTVFAGVFTMGSAAAVLADDAAARQDVTDCVVNLIGKSLVAANIDGPVAEYRLLDTTRAYAQLKLDESGESADLARRHAAHYRALLESARDAWESRPAAEWLEGHRHLIDNVRVALDWSFSPAGDAAIGVALTLAALPLWFQLSLLSETYERVQRARAATPADHDAMRLDAALAWSLMQIKGSVAETRAAWNRVFERAHALGDADYQLRALWGLWSGRLNSGNLKEALTLAQRFHDLAAQQVDRADFFVGDRMVGYTLHLLGDQAAARRYIERMLGGYVVPVTGAQIIRFVFDQRATSRCFLARIQWLQGFADQAMRLVDNIVDSALAGRAALTLCQVLVQAACPLALLVGDWAAAERFVGMLNDHATRHGLEFWQTWGRSYHGLLLIRRGDAAGLQRLDAAIRDLRSIEFGIYFTSFLGAFAEGLGQAGETAQALAVIDQALARSDANDERWCVADLLRIKGDLLLQGGAPGAAAEAETHFLQALDWARQQEVWSWELRVATSLARLWGGLGRVVAARELLAASYGRFTEGFATADLLAAKALLDALT
jgi:predicted ATPase